ncbi:Chloroperoxidase [Mycena leptocephala]|nr:Chloroperoxidase [Mycena leptocephala]
MPQVFSHWALDSSAAIKDRRGPVCALCEPSMRPSTTLYILLPTLVSAATIARRATEVQEGQTGTLITSPPLPTNTGLQQVPDANHPFIAPGPNDQRGPCPGMNTLANHGYIPRNGIASFEEIVTGAMEAFNVQSGLMEFITAANMMMRGNPFANTVSIGGSSPLVPSLPGNIGSPHPGGIALHGGFEGDASMTRADAFIGDNRNFQDILYDLDLLQLGKFGDNGPNGNNTVFNVATMIGIKQQNLAMDQAANPQFAVPPRRLSAMFTEASFVLNVFANGTTKQATLPIVGSFFRNQTFPKNWFRAATPVSGAESAGEIFAGVPDIVPGRNNEQGAYVADPPPPAPFNASTGCATYWDLLGTMPAGLANTTGLFKQNVDFLVNILFQSVANSPCNQTMLFPFGPNVN